VPFNEVVQLRRSSGDPVKVGDVTVTPQSQALIVRWPWGGFVWNRPVAVTVERDGRRERLPVPDVTRWAQVGILVAGLAFLTMGWAASVRRNGKQRRE
jgi:hypothetical protein